MTARKIFAAALVVGLTSVLPLSAQELSKEELIAYAAQQGVCVGGEVPVDAYYETATAVRVVCGAATGFLPAAGGLGVAGGAAAALGGIALMAGGGGDGASSTTTTSSTN